ncbi:MAG: glycosyltransferase, partial [Methanosarcinales archaeon]
LTKKDLYGKETAIPNRYHLGHALFDKYGSKRLGVNKAKEATNKYFGSKSKPTAYIAPEDFDPSGKNGLPLEEVLRFIVKERGIVVFAHPKEKLKNINKVKQILEKYATVELDGKDYLCFRGVEVYSSKHSKADQKELLEMVKELNESHPVYSKYKLMATVGSDGHNEQGIYIGIGSTKNDPNGNIPASVATYKIVEDLKNQQYSKVKTRPIPKTIGIIIPTRRGGAIDKFIYEIPKQKLKEQGYEVTVYIVALELSEKIAEIARSYNAEVIIEKRKGKARAIKTAFEKLKDKHDYYIMLDADATYPPAYIPDIVALLNKNDVVIGSRLKGVMEKGAMPKTHLFGNKIITWIGNTLYRWVGLYKCEVSDICTGYWGFRKEVVKNIVIDSEGFDLEANLFAEVVKQGYKIGEVPILYRRSLTPSSLKKSDAFRIIRYLYRALLPLAEEEKIKDVPEKIEQNESAIALWVVRHLAEQGIITTPMLIKVIEMFDEPWIDPEPRLRLETFKLLVQKKTQIITPEVIQKLISSCKHSMGKFRAYEALEYAIQIKPELITKELIQLVTSWHRSSYDQEMRLRLISIMVSLKQEVIIEVVQPVISLLKSESFTVRKKAMEVFKKLAQIKPEVITPERIDFICNGFEDDYHVVREVALETFLNLALLNNNVVTQKNLKVIKKMSSFRSGNPKSVRNKALYVYNALKNAIIILPHLYLLGSL